FSRPSDGVLRAWLCSSSWLYSASTCRKRSAERLLRRGLISSTLSSENTTPPTRSPLSTVVQQTMAAASAATTDLKATWEPKYMAWLWSTPMMTGRSEEHTSELQSRENLVCRLLLEKKKQNNKHRQQY